MVRLRALQGVWVLLLLLVSSMTVLAQDREDDIPSIPFAVTGGRADNVLYYMRERGEDFSRLYTAINTAIPVINQITGFPWDDQIVVVMMGSSAGGQTAIGRYLYLPQAYVTRRETRRPLDLEACHLRIFDGWEARTDFETVITRELFHCFQMSLGTLQISDFSDVSRFWWIQGIAEWMSYRAFPAQFPRIVHSAFDARVDVTKARFDAFYFWEFMASAGGFGDPKQIIAQMEALSRSEDLFPLVYAYPPTELFHNWALALYNKTLPIAPIVDMTASDLPAGQNGNLATALQRFSADYKNLIGFEMQPDKIAYIRVTGIDDGNYAVSFQTPTGMQRLQEGAPFEFCPADSGNMLILSRGRGEAGSAPLLTLEWGQNSSPTPCKPKPQENDPGAANCVVGLWAVATYPPTLLSLGAELDLSEFTFAFEADGTLEIIYGLTAKIDSATIRAHVPFAGTYELEATENGVYNVFAFEATAVAGGTFTITAHDGTTTDLSRPFYSNSSAFTAWTPAGELTCDEDIMTWETTDGSGEFILARLF